MSALIEQVKTAAHIFGYYWNKPSRWNEIPAWIRGRGSSTLDMREPWWSRPAIDAVKSSLPSDARVFEFGGGGSTLWLADRAAEIVTVEHDPKWFDVLKKLAPANVRIELRQPRSQGSITSDSAPGKFFNDYVDAIIEQPDRVFDLIIVDGRARVACGRAAISKLKRGGMLFLDDSNRQRYSALFEDLQAWDRVDYLGLKRAGGGMAQSTIWTRP